MSTRPNLRQIIQRAADKAVARREGDFAPCLADRLAEDLAAMPSTELEATLKDWIVAAGRPDATPFLRMRSEIAFNWLKEVGP